MTKLSPKSLAGATIVFDLDGALVDSAPDLAATLNALLTQEGLPPVTPAAARSMIGHGARALLASGFAAAGRPLAEPRISTLFERFIDHYRAHIADHSALFPGVEAALDTLSAAGATLAVCTNKRTDLAIALLDALGLTGRFAAVVGPDRAPAAKPDPRHLTTTLELVSGRADRAVMVGDSASDARAARAAAVPLVLVDFGYSHIPARDLAPDVLISHFDQLPAACAELLGPALSAPGAGAIRPSPAQDA
jgi:phosphoglycolate phosphatase